VDISLPSLSPEFQDWLSGPGADGLEIIDVEGDTGSYKTSTTCKTPRRTLDRCGRDPMKVLCEAEIRQWAPRSDFWKYGSKDRLDFSKCDVVFLGTQSE
jgi:hypothetical protein